MEQAAKVLSDLGWTPQKKKRRNGVPYLYAVRRYPKPSNKLMWKYIAPVSRLEKMTEEEVLGRLK